MDGEWQEEGWEVHGWEKSSKIFDKDEIWTRFEEKGAKNFMKLKIKILKLEIFLHSK